MDLLGVMEMSTERTWKVSGGEVKLGGMAPDTPKFALPLPPRSFISLIISTIMTWWPSSKISALATEWGPAKVLPIGPRTC